MPIRICYQNLYFWLYRAWFKSHIDHIIKTGEAQLITLPSASGDYDFGPYYNAPLIFDGMEREGLYLIPESFRC